MKLALSLVGSARKRVRQRRRCNVQRSARSGTVRASRNLHSDSRREEELALLTQLGSCLQMLLRYNTEYVRQCNAQRPRGAHSKLPMENTYDRH
jgi:hypothetical protein